MSSKFAVGYKLTGLEDLNALPVGTHIAHNYLEDEKFTKTDDGGWQPTLNRQFVNYVGPEEVEAYFDCKSIIVTHLPEESSPVINILGSKITGSLTIEPFPEETPRGSVLLEARTLITGDRNVTYGSPVQNFKTIGEMWSSRLRHKLRDNTEITGSDVADFMVLVKVARNVAQPKRDNYTDGAGYFACGYENLVAEQDED